MKKIFTLCFFFVALSANTVLGQISTTNVKTKTEESQVKYYDGTKNFLGKDVYAYIGQDLYLIGIPENRRKFGFKGFILDYNKSSSNKNNVYKPLSEPNYYASQYEDLAERYYHVLDVIRHPSFKENDFLYGNIYFLKLKEKESGDILYYEYSAEYITAFPFLVVKYFEKQKEKHIGQEFIFREGLMDYAKDINTGKNISVRLGQKWKCIDMTIEDRFYNLSLVLVNSLGETALLYYTTIVRGFGVFTSAQADTYVKKFGKANFDEILQGNVKIGMTKEMCELSWGEPKNINTTTTANRKTEQWVYYNNYLYFRNGLLTTIQ